MEEQLIDCVYDNSYFKINKKLQTYSGLWPYESRLNKLIPRIILYAILFVAMIPLCNGCKTWCGVNLDICGENIIGILYTVSIVLKYWTTTLSENKLRQIYHRVAKHWLNTTDPEEHAILIKYAKLGKIKTIGYVVYLSMAGFSFCQLPMTPIILDLIMPLNESRPKLLFVKGEFIIDPFEHFYKLYVYFMAASLTTITAVAAIDTTYTVIVHQILGMISTVKHRLYQATVSFDSKKDVSFDIIISAVHLHKEALQFIDFIEKSYSLTFLILMGFTVLFISIGTVVVIVQVGAIIDLVRLLLIVVGIILHFLYISWPGQLLIDHTSELFIFTYATEWYNISERSKQLLRIVMLKCIKPSTFTAGGLYIMNLQNFGSIIRSAISYIAVIFSFR